MTPSTSPRAAPYAPLWCKSHFSFLEGASDPGELVEEARHLGLRSLALTDRDGVPGAVEALTAAEEHGLHLVLGSEITLEDDSTLVLLAADGEGWARLCGLVTAGRLRSRKGACRILHEELLVAAAAGPGLLGLWGGERSSLAAPEAGAPGDLARRSGLSLSHDTELSLSHDTGASSLTTGAAPRTSAPAASWNASFAGHLRDAFGDRLHALVDRHLRAEEVPRERRLLRRAAALGLPLVAATEVLYHAPPRRELHDILTCIRHGVTLATAGRLLPPNAEHGLLPPATFRERYADLTGAVERTLELAARCTFSLRDLRYRYPGEDLPDGTTPSAWLRHLTLEGAQGRYGGTVPAAVTKQVEKELALIEELDYGGYFLTMYAIVRFCREQGILCQGRGSAANSAVCFCLGITAVDPVRMDLLFERFLSRERAEPPDIDLDIEHERREEVIQWVYARFGRDRAAMVANVIRYRAKSAVREVGKALGLAGTAMDRLSRFVGWDHGPTPEALEAAGLDPELPAHRHLMRLTEEIQGFPRHLSIHPGGFLLGHEPVHRLVPVENASMEGRTVIQWDKDSVEALGLFKVDLLGLGALTHLRKTFALLREHGGPDLCMATIPPEDPATFAMVTAGDTVGVFQVESRAQMNMLPRMRPACFYDLVIEISIVRPGPISGGMVHPYLRRRRGEEPVTYPHPVLEPVLRKTLGIPLFQEQVMKLAVVAADYTPGEADQLRRDMAAWRRHGRLEAHRERLVTRMMGKGIEREFAERVFEQIRGFGEYGFPESHAASFALIAYATAWLRRHHPDAFTAALLNSLPMGFYSAATLVSDAQRHGVEVRPVCVERSARDCTLEPAEGLSGNNFVTPRPSEAAGCRSSFGQGPKGPRRFAVRMGLRFVRGMAAEDGRRIDEARRAGGAFRTVAQLAARARLGERALSLLARAGALENIEEGGRRGALWKARGIHRGPVLDLPVVMEERSVDFANLDAFETLRWDHDVTGHSPRGHPLEPLRETLRRKGLPDAATVNAMEHGRPVRYAGLVICRQRPGTASGVVFLTLEDETGFVNAVLWARVFEQHAAIVRTTSFLGLSGTLERSDGVVHLVVSSAWLPDVTANAMKVESHDFH